MFALAEHTTAGERASALPRHLACELFDAWCPEHRVVGGAITTLMELSVALGGRLSDDTTTLRSRAWSALRDGRVLVLRGGRAEARAAASPAERREVQLASAVMKPAEVKTWITIRLVDDDTPPKPVAGARYRIRLPDGSVREGRLDREGIAHYETIDPGLCDVSFLEYDKDSWKLLG